MSIRALLITVFGLLTAALIAQAVVSYMQTQEVAALREAEDRRFDSHLLADEMRQSSDELTRFARTYAVTEDARFEEYFREVLRIRDGEVPRPDNYHGIYWDFVAATARQPAATGRKIPLLDLMKEKGFTEAEFEKLQIAKERSDALVQLEDRAMNAMKGRFDTKVGEPDPTLARRLLHGAEYHKAKAAIMHPIQEFFTLVEKRTANEVATHRDRGAALGWASLIIAILAGLIAAAAYVGLTRRMVKPVIGVGERLQGMAADMHSTSQEQQAGAAEQSSAVEETRRTFTGLLDATQSLSRIGEDVLANAELSQRNAQSIASRIDDLSTSTATINEILALVKDVANKSEILALNAALEGSKAGDAGRGFSLVATQMQRLAEQVMGSVKKIEVLTGVITKSSTSAVLAAEEAEKVATSTTAAAREISAAVAQQQSGAEQVSVAMDEIGHVAHNNVEAARGIVSAANGLITLAEKLQATLHGKTE